MHCNNWIGLLAVLAVLALTKAGKCDILLHFRHNFILNANSSSHLEPIQKHSFEDSVCRVLENRFVSSNPWTSYPIVYNPIHHGRLIVWTATSSLPTSEFKCSPAPSSLNGTNLFKEILLDFGTSSSKIEWTFYDVNKGLTYNGVSVNHAEGSKFLMSVENGQSSSYLNCNLIRNISSLFSDNNELEEIELQTTCQDCGYSLIKLINSQLSELIRSNLKSQLVENLYWHLAQLVTNQQFQSPTEIV